MKKINTAKFFLGFSFLFSLSILKAQTPTWSDKIANIVYKNCTSCHHTGGAAPFSLMTYASTANMAGGIYNSVSRGHMPPWPPDPKYRELAYQRVLSESDKQALLNWASNGTPAGNLANAPTPPSYTVGAVIANPDWQTRIPMYSPNTNSDVYRCFPVRSGFSVDKFITSFEVIPGNGSIVHHVLVYQDLSNNCFDLDAQDPEPGYTSFGGIGSNSAKLIGAWVPGSQVFATPAGMGIKLDANTNIVLQIHYAPNSRGQNDSTQVRIKFSSQTNLRNVSINPILNHAFSLTNGPLVIPANTVKTFNSRFTMPADVTLLNVGPHMHLIGKSIKAWGVTPQNDTIKLINIPNWDFHWQGSYAFRKLQKIPRGTVLQGEALYDNTTANPNQPSSPPREVRVGESTLDEMMLVYFAYTPYQAGDENIIVDSTAFTPTLEAPPLSIGRFEVFPNPIKSHCTLDFDLEENEKLDVQIFDYQGILQKNVSTQNSFSAGKNQLEIDMSDLSTGIYFIKLSNEKRASVRQVVKM